MSAAVLLVRHTAVAENCQGLCYGRSDVPLSATGEQDALRLVAEFARRPVRCVWHSGLQRTRFLAERLADRLGCELRATSALRERDFGTWELRPWDDLFQQHGEEMLQMVTSPDKYRPGGGETTTQLQQRVVHWWQQLQPEGLQLVVTHGGPIAALRGTLGGLPVAEWVSLIPGYGESVSVEWTTTKAVSPLEELTTVGRDEVS